MSKTRKTNKLESVEICAGAGGQAFGLEQAGFSHLALVENDAAACETLRTNRPKWNTLEGDLKLFSGVQYRGIDLLAGGVPCPPFTTAGKQLGSADERDLFPEALRLVEETDPKAVMLENVQGFAKEKFTDYREQILQFFENHGYVADYRVLRASDYGVPQLRPRFILVAIKRAYAKYFVWPEPTKKRTTVGEVLYGLMAVNGWKGAKSWADRAGDIAPTLVGGSKKHGGADLGPTRAKQQWAKLGVDGKGLAADAPAKDFPADGIPRLTVQMAARIQGFPEDWVFAGKKTAAYRQVGNAFPPPVAAAVGKQIHNALMKRKVNISAGSQLKLFGHA